MCICIYHKDKVLETDTLTVKEAILKSWLSLESGLEFGESSEDYEFLYSSVLCVSLIRMYLQYTYKN